MPAKTIYVKYADLAKLDKLRKTTGKSVSSLFAEFIRERYEEAAQGMNRENVTIVESQRGDGVEITAIESECDLLTWQPQDIRNAPSAVIMPIEIQKALDSVGAVPAPMRTITLSNGMQFTTCFPIQELHSINGLMFTENAK